MLARMNAGKVPNSLAQLPSGTSAARKALAAGFIVNKADFLFQLCRLSRIALRDGRHMVPSLSAEPKNLAVIAKRIYLTGIGRDLNDLPCHAILPAGRG